MALPLDPVTSDEMFPDTYVAPFVTSEEVAELAGQVIATWDEMLVIREALESKAHPLVIAYVLDTKKMTPDVDWTVHTIVNVTKAPPLWRSLAGIDVVVAYREHFWDMHEEAERRGFLHHGLSHIDRLGGKVSLKPHPAEGFPWTFRRYGPLSIGERMFARAGSLWNEDHPQEPTPLRTVEAAVEEFRQGVELGDIDVTISAGEKSATIRGKGKAAPTYVSQDPDDAVARALAEMAEVDTALRCVGSNHVPGCDHVGPTPRRTAGDA